MLCSPNSDPKRYSIRRIAHEPTDPLGAMIASHDTSNLNPSHGATVYLHRNGEAYSRPAYVAGRPARTMSKM